MKTTQADFAKFKDYCETWQNKLGIKDWSIFYDHADLDAYATTHWKLTEAVATIVLCKDWDELRTKTDHELNRLALHECLHILLAPLTAEAFERFTTDKSVDAAEHRVIRQLENLV